MKEWHKQLGERMRFIRRMRSLKQAEVCADVGLKQSQLSRYENGLGRPSFYEMLRFARLYRCTLAAFDCERSLGDLDQLLPQA
ncbi:MAG: helix-turn-helix transcriptional regulator [Flavobacteriales bacterium]|nr:helix-turn-helix transcriptional regulator [Flavobacteriales bacterium]